MKKTLRLDLYQETACYKKPMAFKVGETYPLPPYSTVKGMIHALIDATEFIPMRISVQGSYDSQIIDYQSHYFFKKMDVAEFPLVMDGIVEKYEFSTMTTMPLYTHLLYDVNLVIHIEAEAEIIDKIMVAIESGKSISLGRWEDIVRIDRYEVVDVREEKKGKNNYNAFVPISQIHRRLTYIPYNLNWKYKIINGIRSWEKIKVGYVEKRQPFSNCLIDSYNDLLFFNC